MENQVHEASKDDSQLSELLICPKRDLRIDSRLQIPVAESVFELVKQLEAKAAVLSIGDIRLLEMFVKYADLFGVRLGVLTNVPGADYDVHWDRIVFALDNVGYDSLVMDLESKTRMDALKRAENAQSVNKGEAYPEIDVPRFKPSDKHSGFRNNFGSKKDPGRKVNMDENDIDGDSDE